MVQDHHKSPERGLHNSVQQGGVTKKLSTLKDTCETTGSTKMIKNGEMRLKGDRPLSSVFSSGKILNQIHWIHMGRFKQTSKVFSIAFSYKYVHGYINIQTKNYISIRAADHSTSTPKNVGEHPPSSTPKTTVNVTSGRRDAHRCWDFGRGTYNTSEHVLQHSPSGNAP